MSAIFGTNERLIVDDVPDSDGELNISMAVYSSDYEHTDTWIDKEQAEALIAHLRAAFDL